MDITKEKLSIEEIEKERLSHRRILDQMPDGIYMVDSNCRIRYTNPVMREWFGDPEGKFCHQYIYNETDRCPWCHNQEIFEDKTVLKEWENPVTGYIYELFATSFTSPEGEDFLLYFFHDITRLRTTEEKLAETNKAALKLIE